MRSIEPYILSLLSEEDKMYELIFANFDMHIALDAEEIADIKSKLEYKKVKKNTMLLQAGEVCKSIYFVNQGCLRIFNTDEKGEEHNLLFLPENWWAVEMTSFSEQKPAFYTISALVETELFYLNYNVLEELYLTIPKLERFYRIMIQNGFNMYQQRITSSLSMPAEERYRAFQKQYPRLEQRIAQKHIASYLGITPVFLSMMRKKYLGP